jgi:hypothetical protein
MHRASVVIRLLVQAVPWFSLAVVTAGLAFAMNTMVTHVAWATPTVTSSQHEERESFIRKRCLRGAEIQFAPCTELTSAGGPPAP